MSCEIIITGKSNDGKRQKKKVPYDFYDLDNKLDTKIRNLYKNFPNMVLVGPKKYCLPSTFMDAAVDIYNFPIRKDDVWIFGHLRTGTTLTREMVWLIANDLDFEKASKTILDWRVPFFERHIFTDHLQFNATDQEKIHKFYPTFQSFSNTKERRFFKSHLPLSLVNPEIFTKGCKIILTIRNPKDCIVSNYLFTSLFGTFNDHIGLEEYWKSMRDNLVTYDPFFEHLKEIWAERNNKNVLLLTYEEFINDKRNTFKKVATFLEKSLTDEQLDKLENHFQINNFRNNTSVNNNLMCNLKLMQETCPNFIRRGKNGGWRDYFDEKMNKEFDEWIEKSMKGSDLKFYE